MNRITRPFAALLLGAGVLLAQGAAPPGDPYKISPGDKIEIRVYGEPSLSAVFPVPPYGSINYPLIGEFPVAGQTTREVEQEVAKRLVAREILKAPMVTVLVQEYASQAVYVLGEVGHSGVFSIPARSKLLLVHLISMAGGFTENADRSRVQVDRYVGRERKTIIVDFLGEGGGEDPRKYMEIDAGDQVTVPMLGSVYVVGEVSSAGEIHVPASGQGIVEVLALAGLRMYEASTSKIRVLRGRTHAPVVIDVESLLESDRPVAIPKVLPGDIIYVPRGGAFR